MEKKKKQKDSTPHKGHRSGHGDIKYDPDAEGPKGEKGKSLAVNFNKPEALQTLEDLAATGMPETEICKIMRLSTGTLRKRKLDTDGVSRAIDQGRDRYHYTMVEVAEYALHKSVQGQFVEEEETTYEDDKKELVSSCKVKKRWIAPNITAAIFLLKKRFPSVYADIVDDPEQDTDSLLESASNEQLKAIEAIMSMNPEELKGLVKDDEEGEE